MSNEVQNFVTVLQNVADYVSIGKQVGETWVLPRNVVLGYEVIETFYTYECHCRQLECTKKERRPNKSSVSDMRLRKDACTSWSLSCKQV
jgi:hypothetical protein